MFRISNDSKYELSFAEKRWCSNRRSISAFSFFENQGKLHEDVNYLLTTNPGNYQAKTKAVPVSNLCDEITTKKLDKQDKLLNVNRQISSIKLNATNVGDFPAQYTIYLLGDHQFPVIGAYVDKRVIPGFRYRVRCLPGITQKERREKYLFHGKSLALLSIGRGYAKRLTFKSNKYFSKEESYFYSDNHLEGYAFELQAVFDGDKFMIYDTNHEPQGIMEVIKANLKQVEIHTIYTKRGIERKVNVKLTANVEFYDCGISQVILTGTAICVKHKNQETAKVIKIIDVTIKNHRYYLVPGYQEDCRKIYIRGNDIGDAPTQYTISGLLPYEMPVIGTYVDPRILPGFCYRVRLNKRKKYLFNGKSLRLRSIGLGYAKRITFDSNTTINPNNFLWSDNHQDGLAFQIQVIFEKMKFQIVANGQIVGEAEVFRTDSPQVEERMEKIKIFDNRHSYIKYVHVDMMCQIKLDINDTGAFYNENLIRVHGLAVVRKDPNTRDAYLTRVKNIGLDSQLNVIFTRMSIQLSFLPVL